MFNKNPDLLKELKRSGWTPERRIPIDELNIFEAASKFLSNWGNIVVSRTNIQGTDWFDFNWKRASEGYSEITAEFSSLLGHPLFVVGECDCSHHPILIDDLGRFFRDVDTILHPVALNPEQLVYNLWNGPYYDKTGLENIPSIDRKILRGEKNGQKPI